MTRKKGAFTPLTCRLEVECREECDQRLYKAAYPDARPLDTPDAFVDYVTRWQRNTEYRVIRGRDIANVNAPYFCNLGWGGASASASAFTGSNLRVPGLLYVGVSNTQPGPGQAGTPFSMVVGATAGAANDGNLVVTPGYVSTQSDALVGSNLVVNGAVGIGMSNEDPATCPLTVAGNVRISGVLTQDSDARVKRNVEPLVGALHKLRTLSGYSFELAATSTGGTTGASGGPQPPRRHVGLIAQEVERVLPEAVYRSDAGVRSIAYGNLVGLLTQAIRDLDEQVARSLHRLEQRLADVERGGGRPERPECPECPAPNPQP
jgi:hypothetical protein